MKTLSLLKRALREMKTLPLLETSLLLLKRDEISISPEERS
jgi:hypothetical protein